MLKNCLQKLVLCACLMSSTAIYAQNFTITNSANKVVGNGVLDVRNDNSVQAIIQLEGQQIFGGGLIDKDARAFASEKRMQGLRPDRALMQRLSTNAKQFVKLTFVKPEGNNLSCQFIVRHENVNGQCINLSSQQVLTISPAMTDEHS